MELSVGVLRELFRHLLQWRSLYTSDGVDTIHGPEGFSISIWDLEYLYEVSQVILPIRQRQAIRLCLILNYSEQDAADVMKIDQTNPVAMYATSGLEKIVHMLRFDILPSREYVFSTYKKKTSRSRRTPDSPGSFSIETPIAMSPYMGIEVSTEETRCFISPASSLTKSTTRS